jgi:hypothetical protein
MNFYDQQTTEFSKASKLFKAGNCLMFFRDMTHRLSDLQFTKERCLERHSEFEAVDITCDAKTESVMLRDSLPVSELDLAISEVRRVLEVVSNLIENPQYGACTASSTLRPRETPLDTNNFNQTLKLLQKVHLHFDSPEADATSTSSVYQSYQPELLKTLKRSVPKQLRTLEELCLHGTESGLAILSSIYKYFKRDSVTLLLEREDIAKLAPSCGLVTIGRSVFINFSTAAVDPCVCQASSSEACSVVCSPAADHSSNSCDSASGFHTCESTDSFSSCVADVGQLNDSSPQLESPTLCDTTLASPETTQNTICRSFDVSTTAVSDVSQTMNTAAVSTGRPQTLPLSSSLSTINRLPQQTSVITIADHVEHLTHSSLGFGLLYFVHQFAVSTHVLFSLLIGRPVIILGSAFSEKQIRAVINALWTFVPGHFSQYSAVIPWSTTPLSLTDLSHVKLCGLGQPEEKSFEQMITADIKNFVTVLNLDRKSLWGPKYSGELLSDIISAKDHFTADNAYVAYIHSKLFDLVQKSFIYYHTLTPTIASNSSDRVGNSFERKEWSYAAQSVCSHLRLDNSDLLIVNYLVEMVKKQQSLEINRHTCSDDIAQSSLHLNCLPCQTFRI